MPSKSEFKKADESRQSMQLNNTQNMYNDSLATTELDSFLALTKFQDPQYLVRTCGNSNNEALLPFSSRLDSDAYLVPARENMP
ncbi:hypothetical protein Ciccas_002381 [Cichlidogyrus casuarinus]|uniref:Uncharacterized protein n=1 Tax=Cichlidogyrus casuarinus TaxID=1844966 RepID=A0ABD2QID3_9PLAT